LHFAITSSVYKDYSRFIETLLSSKPSQKLTRAFEEAAISSELVAPALLLITRGTVNEQQLKQNRKRKMRTITKLGLSAIAAVAMAYNASAIQITFLDPNVSGTAYQLGTIDPGQPDTYGGLVNTDVYEVNKLIGMALNATATDSGNTYVRSGNSFSPLPAATATGAVSASGGGISTTTVSGVSYAVIHLAPGGNNYLVAKWDGPNNAAMAWDIAGLTGDIYVVQNDDLGDIGNARGMTGWTLMNAGTVTVPDGGATVAMLGMVLGVFALARRKMA
jgi:hypothetical protein